MNRNDPKKQPIGSQNSLDPLAAPPTPPDALRRPSLWAIAGSLRVGIGLLVLTAAASVAGTLIQPIDRAIALVYASWWYQALLAALALSMTVAAIRTLVRHKLPALKPRFHDSEDFYDRHVLRETLPFAGSAPDAAARLRRAGFRVFIHGPLGFARRGALRLLGSTITHAGLVAILASGFLSALTATRGDVTVMEGQETDAFRLETPRTTEQSLGITLRCDDFDTAFFPRSRVPSHFRATLSSPDAEPPLRNATVETNRPLRAGRWRVLLNSYESIPAARRFLVRLQPPATDQTIPPFEISPGQTRTVPDASHLTLRLDAGYPYRWTLDERNAPIARGTLGNAPPPPALRLGQTTPLFDAPPTSTPQGASPAWTLTRRSDTPAFLVTLTVTRNPAMPFVYAGCAILVIGLLICFMVRRTEIWFRIDPEARQIRLAASSRGQHPEWDRASRRALAELRRTG